MRKPLRLISGSSPFNILFAAGVIMKCATDLLTSMTDTRPRSESRSRRRPAGASASGTSPRAASYRSLVNPFEPLRVFSDDQVAAIHGAALGILSRDGMRVLSARARNAFAAAGAAVEEASQTVRLDPDLVGTLIRNVPAQFILQAVNADRTVHVGGRRVVIAPVGGPPNVSDLERGRRPGSLSALEDFFRMSQAFDVIHLLSPCVEPQDVPPHERHLDTTFAQLTLSDKLPFVFSRGAAQIADCFAMLRIAHRIAEPGFGEKIVCYTVVNTNSPLQLDVAMAEGIMDFAAAGQLVIVTPFTLAGAMAPVTIVGALTLAHAEALLGICLAQIVRPGTAVVYGSFTSNVDMKSGSPAFGTPEYAKAAFGAGQLARHLHIPWRCSSATAANYPDGQAMYESQMSLWGALLGGCNILIHGAGWLEGGLTASYEKFILDVEMLQMFAELFRPVSADEAEMGLEAISGVGPGGHFFGAAHTMTRYRDAFYSPLVSDWRNFGAWSEAGGLTATQRAHELWKQTLREFRPPQVPAEVREQLVDFVARRKAEGGAAPPS